MQGIKLKIGNTVKSEDNNSKPSVTIPVTPSPTASQTLSLPQKTTLTIQTPQISNQAPPQLSVQTGNGNGNGKVTLSLGKTSPGQTVTLKTQQKPQQKLSTELTDSQRVGADNYSRFADQRDHIYNIPDTYVGSAKRLARDERIFNLETGQFQYATTDLPEAIVRVFMEIYSNAGDNSARSLRKGLDPGEVSITMNETTIKVRNGGIPIPVEKALPPDETLWVPEVIFGILMSSSNYNKEKIRMECGRNGFGAKLTNIFSKCFKITVADPHNEKLYKQTWSENMKVKSAPEITHYKKTDVPYVEVEYTLDFARFGYEKYPAETFPLFARHAADISFALKIPVSFNGKKFNVQTAKDYAKLYFPKEIVKSSVLYYEWPKDTKTITKKGVEFSEERGALPTIEICAVDTPDEAMRVSFVNGLFMRNGGVHCESIFKAVASGVLETINGSISGKKKRGDKKGEKSTKTPKLTLGDVKRHISLFINCWLPDPVFDSQSKNELKDPTPKVVIDEAVLRPIMRWELVNRLYAELEAKQFKAATKTDGKKKKHLTGMAALHEANLAATNESHNCTLYVTEGNSALTFALKLCSYVPNGKGRDYIGAFPLRGKLLNVRNAPLMQVLENKEIANLKKILGLKEGIDYTIEENYKTLRYGHLMVLTDADTDGKHILGLIMNLFACKYPSLLQRGYIKYLRTKILQGVKNKQKVKFYTMNEYEEWKKQTPDHDSWTFKYYKGLGTSNDSDIEDESKAMRIVLTLYDQQAPDSLRLAFDQSLANCRKEWITKWVPDPSVEALQYQPISSFIHHEFIQFSIADIVRSIPGFMDGLKVSQRKIMWGALKNWRNGKTKKKGENGTYKVAQFASYVANKVGYHHGEKSLEKAIVAMAQDFVGSNNLPLLQKDGEFGTRNQLGADASAGRYIFCAPHWSTPLIFRKEDTPILEIQLEEGEKIEPKTLLPILPLHVLNGVVGIGSGFSSSIMSHNPIDLCYWYEARIKGLPLPKLVPWFNGFKGKIELKRRGKRKAKRTEDANEDNESNEGEEKNNGEENNEGKNNEEESNENIEESNENEESSPKNVGFKRGVEEEDEDDDYEDYDDEDEVGIDKNTRLTMVSKGVFEIGGTPKRPVIYITELPIGRSIEKYVKFLEELREKKEITNFHDYSKPDEPNFEVYGMKSKPTYKNLKLIKSYGMNNMVLLDSLNRPIKYDTVNDILETFYHMRLPYYRKRKEYILSDIDKVMEVLRNKIKFINMVIEGYELIKKNPQITVEEANALNAILVIKKAKKIVMEQMEKFGLNKELLNRINIYSLTEEEIQSAVDEVTKLEEERKIKENMPPEQYWMNDIEEFAKEYCKRTGCTYSPPKRAVIKILPNIKTE